jgi:hypothetical protein
MGQAAFLLIGTFLKERDEWRTGKNQVLGGGKRRAE